MKDFNNLFEMASSVSFAEHINSLSFNENITYMELSHNQINALICKLNSFPEKYIHILFLYCSKVKTSNIERLLNISNIDQYVHYLNQTLSTSIGLEHSLIAYNSMKNACSKVLTDTASNLLSTAPSENIEYSKEFKRKINKIIPHYFVSNSHQWLKKVAVILIIMVVGTTSIFTFNVTARQKLFNWLIHTFPEYSEFFTTTENTDSAELDKYKVTYIPNGFYLYQKSTFDSLITEEYKNDSDKYIWVLKQLSENSPVTLNTENADVQWYFYKDTEYIYWKNENVHYVTWEKDGIIFSLNTNIDKKTCIKIAESVKK